AKQNVVSLINPGGIGADRPGCLGEQQTKSVTSLTLRSRDTPKRYKRIIIPGICIVFGAFLL
ncbi:MAG: hypothetical protein KAR21_26680, partial [Spirochaetales bacterium]|nr:hypothetical protein [Spirochaetales bacterium]